MSIMSRLSLFWQKPRTCPLEQLAITTPRSPEEIQQGFAQLRIAEMTPEQAGESKPESRKIIPSSPFPGMNRPVTSAERAKIEAFFDEFEAKYKKTPS